MLACLSDVNNIVTPVWTEDVGSVAKTNGMCFGDARTASAAGLLGSPILVVSGELGRFGDAPFFMVQFSCCFVVRQFFAVAICADDFAEFATGVMVEDGAFVNGVVKHFGEHCAIWKLD